MKEIGKKELEAFKEFENKILSLKDERVKYSEIEARIKKDVLFENFGEEQTNDLLNKLSLTFLDLADQSTYIEIYNFLAENKKNV